LFGFAEARDEEIEKLLLATPIVVEAVFVFVLAAAVVLEAVVAEAGGVDAATARGSFVFVALQDSEGRGAALGGGAADAPCWCSAESIVIYICFVVTIIVTGI